MADDLERAMGKVDGEWAPEVKAAWGELPWEERVRRAEELKARAANPGQVETTVKPMGGLAMLDGASRTRPEEWKPEDRDEPGEPHAYGGQPEDADRIVEIDDDAYERV